jgi:signal transduction histidine kinase
VAQKSLKSQIVKYGFVSLASTGVFISGAYLLNRYLTVRQAVDFEGNRLVASARKQAEEILPGLLVPEEYGSIDLQLNKIRETEDLLSATFNKAPDPSLAALLRCPKTSERTHICADYLENQIVTATEVGLPGDVMGYLIKHKRLTSPRQDNIMLLSLAALFCGIALVFLGLIASVLIFIDRHLRKPLLNLNQSLTPILDGESGSELAHFEVTELQSVADQVRQLVRKYEEKKATAATGELAAQVAHDVRSPLAALESLLGELRSLPEDERLIARSAINRIRDIANNLLEKNRAHENAASAEEALRDEAPSVELLSSLVEPLITEKRLQFRSRLGIEIDARLDAGYGLFARVRPREFKRILSNLINNSVEALGARGSVVLTLTSAADGSLLIEIADDGPGIRPEILAKLGQRGETHGKAGGSGLGLYHALTTLKSWGGSLELRSDGRRGTTVALRLPKAPPPEWFVSVLELDARRPVVVLDDDTSIHQVWRGRLAPLEILHFSTPAELRAWVADDAARARNAAYLMDYELLGHKETGLTLIAELGIGERAILVTSRFEEKPILAECLRLKTRLIPKGLAGFVPVRIADAPGAGQPAPAARSARLDAVLIDDDALPRMTWKLAAARAGKEFRSFPTVADFLKEAPEIGRDTPVYVDAELADGVNGARESLKIREMGFQEIYLATGHEAARFADHKHLRGVVGKEPPWSGETAS